MGEKRKALGPGKSAKSKKPHLVWAQASAPQPSSSSSSAPGSGTQPTVRVKNTTYAVSSAGSTSTRRSYVTTTASPKKSRPISPEPDLDWNYLPPERQIIDSDGRDGGWVDCEYQEHLDSIQILPQKRKRTAGDDPIRSWKPHADEYLTELLRLEGRGDFGGSICARCGCDEAIFRCKDCFGGVLCCSHCTVENHRCNPLHRIQRWNGSWFEKTSLKELGLIVQLGHPPGEHCANPEPSTTSSFIILDDHGVHDVSLNYCGCGSAELHSIQLLRYQLFPATVTRPKSAATFRLLEHYHLLSFEAKTSMFAYYYTLARETDNTGISPPKDRYPSFIRMVREWRYLKLLKRRSRGHDPTGIAGTKEGELALECPACPIPGKNLPDDWFLVPIGLMWLYTLYLAMDANFRLSRKSVSSEKKDPALFDGKAYFVEEKAYKEHLAKHSDLPQEPSTCAAHNAVNNDGRGSRGLAATGVGTVDCARHMFKRPCSVGDLQKGERYVNMDYLFFSSLRVANERRLTKQDILRIIVSYDIVCQWHKYLWKRMKIFPHSWHVDHEGKISIIFLIPKFHLPAHIRACHNNFSWNLTKGVGRTDGEAPERGWSDNNPLGPSTKEMGPGSRRDVIDDNLGDSNYKKITHFGVTFLRKIKEAVVERAKHVEAHEDLTATVPESSVAEWTTAVEEWEKDPLNTKNPFDVKVSALTQAAVRKRLAEDEAAEAKRGDAIIIHEDISPAVFVNTGLELEEQQQRLMHDRNQLGQHPTDLQLAKLRERSNALRRKIESWFKIQLSFTPCATVLREQAERNTTHSEIPEVEPEYLKLFLPSAITQHAACSDKLRQFEWQYRLAQANDAINDMRDGLRLRSHLYKFKDSFVRGQWANTRSRTTIQRVENKIDVAAQKYRIAYRALVQLSPFVEDRDWDRLLKPLEKGDVKGLSERGYDESEGRRTISWIWLTPGVDLSPDGVEADNHLHDTLRVEWTRSRARALRWCEEVELLTEEMRRVLAFLLWEADWWEKKVGTRPSLDPAEREGVDAYAYRQASIRRAMRVNFSHLWRYVPEYVARGRPETEDEEVNRELSQDSDDDA